MADVVDEVKPWLGDQWNLDLTVAEWWDRLGRAGWAAPPIYGGTDQVQRNVIGERVFGLPEEPGHDRDTPFSELPKNA